MSKAGKRTTKAGAVALEESQLDDARGGILMPPTKGILIGQNTIGTVAHKDASNIVIKFDSQVKL